MKNLKNSIATALLLITVLASVAYSQTRKGTAASRRGRRSRAAGVKPKANAPRQSSTAISTASGLTYIVTRQGTGKQLKAGDTVVVHYTGLLTNGTKFDSSLDRGAPFTFQLGAGRVIKGWDEGIAQLRVGDQAILIIPPQLGYGAKGAGGVIPPDATLLFIIEVVGINEISPGGATSRNVDFLSPKPRENRRVVKPTEPAQTER